MIVGSYTLYEKFFDYPVDGFTTIIILLLIMGSLLMISLGLIGLYLARIYDEVKQRPRYLLSESIAARSAVRVTSAEMSADVEGAQAHR